jgi:hypothetical protein
MVHKQRTPAHLALLIILGAQALIGATDGAAQTDWETLEKQLPNMVAVGRADSELGYEFELNRTKVLFPDEYLEGGAEAIQAIRKGIEAGRIDTLIGTMLLAHLKDRPALDKLGEDLLSPRKLVSYTRRVAAAIPFVLRHGLPEDEWADLFTKALFKSPTYADSSMIVCLTETEFPGADNGYWVCFRHVDSTSQRRIIERLASACADDGRMWKLLILTGIPEVQNLLLDRLEACKSSLWPAQADSLARFAWGDAAHRVLQHAAKSDTAVYRPLMRGIIYGGKTKEWVYEAMLTLSAEGDTSSIPAIFSRYYESNRETRVVTCIALCRLGDDRGIPALIRIGLRYKKYREESIKALERCTGLAYGEDDEKWLAWLEKNN